MLQVDLGFQPQHAVAWRIDSPKKFKGGEDVDNYLRGMASKIAALPGVEAVGISDTLPLAGTVPGGPEKWVCSTRKESIPVLTPVWWIPIA